MSLISGDNVKSLLRRHLKDIITKKRTSHQIKFCADDLFLFF